MRLDQQILLKSPPLSLLTGSVSALRARVNTLINETNVKYEVATLCQFEMLLLFGPVAMFLEICMQTHSVVFALSRQINKQKVFENN